MNLIATKFAVALMIIALAGCSDASPSGEGTANGPTEVAAPESPEAGDESAEPMEPATPAHFSLERLTGEDEYGTRYTLDMVQPFPQEIADTLDGAGIEFESLEVDDLRAVCLEVDNTRSGQEAQVNGLAVVTSDGTQHEFRTMSDYLFEVSEGMDYNADYDAYMRVFELQEVEQAKEHVAPTAKSTVCLPFDPTLEGDDVTYVAVKGFTLEVPLYPADYESPL